MRKYIIVTGGVLSGLGKGITTASIAKLLQSRGFKVTPIKIDPYLNVDAGTLNPIEHGEVFVTDDGGEIDMDFGHYERFLNISLTKDHNITTGKIYKAVIEKERRGEYLGKTVQVIPHVTNEIKREIREVAEHDDADVVIIEIGGTVGDIENMPFLEAMRQLKLEERNNVIFVHVTLVPIIDKVGEQKTKPTQHSVKELREAGIQPDIIIGRARDILAPEVKEKIALFCNVEKEAVISNPDLDNIYELPIFFEKERLIDIILRKLDLKPKKSDLGKWRELVDRMNRAKIRVRIAITGKYTRLRDSYISIVEALKHASAYLNVKPEIVWIETEEFEKDKNRVSILKEVDGIIVPGGFGKRGAEGKIMAIEFARKNNIPFLGLCFGFQLAVIEFTRNVCGFKEANSTEIDPDTKYPVIDLLPEQRRIKRLGGTMRLGAHKVVIKENTLAYRVYGKKETYERFRHRYEFNNEYKNIIEQHKGVFSGTSEGGSIMQIFENPQCSFFLATQFHPEFKSRLESPHPVFLAFIKASLGNRKNT